MISLAYSLIRQSIFASILSMCLVGSVALAAVGDPAGSEFQVNTYTLAHQQNSSVAIDAAGNFIVVWESSIQAPDDFSGIYAQRFDADGTMLGKEFRVNSITGQDCQLPRVAMNDVGAFVVVWESIDEDGGLHIYSRRFGANGDALDADQVVTANPISDFTFSTKPTVAIDAAGNFVAAWENFDEISGDEDIYARRFGANGVAIGDEFKVNSTTDNEQAAAAIAMNATGNFIVTWQSNAQDGDGEGIFAQLYDSTGTLIKSEFQVNTVTLSDQTVPAVSMNKDGFVVVWQSLNQDGDGSGIYARQYDITGTALGDEFQTNITTAGEQTSPAVAINMEGTIIVWESLGQDGDGNGIFARRYDASGTALGSEFQVNTTTAKDQTLPAVAMNTDGDTVIAWQSYAQDTSWNGVFAQRYLGKNIPPVGVASAATPNGGGGGGSIDLLSAFLLLPAFKWCRSKK